MQEGLDLGLIGDVVLVLHVLVLLDFDAKVDDRVVLEQDAVLIVGRRELSRADVVIVGKVGDLEVEFVIVGD